LSPTTNNVIVTAGVDYSQALTSTTTLSNKFLLESGSTDTLITDALALAVKISDKLALSVGSGLVGGEMSSVFSGLIEKHGGIKGIVGEDDPGGAGLGLAFVRVVTAKHAGEMAVESSPERGATFSISLPVTELMAGRE
jgi:Histidine kinase-, DNA gyrase B-, and HSP90-like ATPase